MTGMTDLRPKALAGTLLRQLLQPGMRSIGLRFERYRPHEDSWRQLGRAYARCGCALMLDVGANAGQFGRDLRIHGIGCPVLSFEPLSAAYTLLQRRARRHRDWTVAERTAVGDRDGEVTINISADSHSSSLLAVLPRLRESAPGAAAVDAETVPIVRLDSYLPAHGYGGVARFALKIDTQGYEAQVLDGAPQTLARTHLLMLELSLVPLYDGAPDYRTMLGRIEGLGYRCIGLHPDFVDPQTFEVMQINAVFARD